MRTKNRSNLQSPRAIRSPCDPGDLDAWFRREAKAIEDLAVRAVVLAVQKNLDAFVRWPQRALLLWEGRDRSTRYHSYPASILQAAQRNSIALDGRENGPAVYAGGVAAGPGGTDPAAATPPAYTAG
jgi:hypothetical protein